MRLQPHTPLLWLRLKQLRRGQAVSKLGAYRLFELEKIGFPCLTTDVSIGKWPFYHAHARTHDGAAGT